MALETVESPTSSSSVPKTSSSFSDRVHGETKLETASEEETSGHVSMEATSHSEVSDVKTKTPEAERVTSDVSRDIMAAQASDKETADNVGGGVRATVSPTMSAESLLSEDAVSETISLGSVTDQDHGDSLQSSQQTSLSASSSSVMSI